jgi:ketosteroid isomerase-like protein
MAATAGNGLTASASTAATKTAAESTAAAWVENFADAWADPVDTDSFCDRFDAWFQPEVRMIQPSVRTVVGKRAFREDFARPLFDLVPDLRGTVENWAVSDDVIYIELRLEGTIGRRRSGGEVCGRRFVMHTCDRITLRDGKAIERFAYLDPAPLVKAVVRSPRAWPRFLRAQLRSLRRPA